MTLGPSGHLQFSHGVQRNTTAIRQVNRQAMQLFEVRPRLIRKPYHQVEAPLSLQDLRDDLAAQRRLDDIVDVADRQPVVRQTLMIQLDAQLRDQLLLFDQRRREPRNGRDDRLDFFGGPTEHFQVVAGDLNGNLRRHPGQHVADQMPNGLFDFVFHARHILDRIVELERSVHREAGECHD